MWSTRAQRKYEKGGHTEVYEQIPGNITDQHGTGSRQTSGSLPVQRRRQDLCLTSCGDAAEYPEEPPFHENGKRLQGGRHRNTTDPYGQGPGGSYVNSTGVFAESGSWSDASDGQSSDDERTRGKERPDQDINDGVQGHRTSALDYHATPKTQVSHVALQTDTYDTLYVKKNTLTAYTIAVVQNSQAVHYDQMHAALQTARNQASLEMPLWAEELLNAHLNLAVLEDHKAIDITPDAPKPAATTQEADWSASAPDDQTYVKIPSRHIGNSASTRPHPTGAVAPTCRTEYGLVNGILAGYEYDDSWDNVSHTHKCTHTHNILPLLALRTWRNSPCRGCEQQQPRQNNNTNV